MLTWDEPGKISSDGKINSIFKDDKNLLGYNVYRNGEIISFVTETEYTDENISPGSYEYYVTALYDEGESIPSNSVWVLGPEPCYPPQNVVAVIINQNEVQIIWEPPVSGDIQSYNLYKNGILMGCTTELNYSFFSWPGTFQFCVSSVCSEGESEWTCCDSLTITYLAPPENLECWLDNDIILHLYWAPPLNSNQWIEWDSGLNSGNGIGLTSGGTFSCASHWTPADLAPYNGFTLTQVSFFPNADPAASYVIKVWTGSSGTTLVSSQNVDSYTVDTWNEITLSTPLLINSSLDLWFGYSVTHGAGTYPAGCDDGPAVQGKGDMISLGGVWEAMSATYGLDYNWNLSGFVYLPGKSNLLMKIMKPNETGRILDHSHINLKTPDTSIDLKKKGFKNLLGYNVYHSINYGNYYVEGYTEETNYELTIAPWNINSFYITAIYDEGESDPSNIVTIVFPSVNENPDYYIQVSPVPAKDHLDIYSQQIIKSVSFYDLYGQLLMNSEVFDKVFQMDVTNFSSSVYLLKIDMGSSILTRKIVIE